MAKHDPQDMTEFELFRRAVDDVKPMQYEPRMVRRSPPPPPRARQRELDERDVMQSLLSDPLYPEDLETGEELLFCRPGVQARTFKKLRRGAYSISAELDLHGLTVEQAREALERFLQQARRGPGYCVRIIHGKGLGSPNRLPVLKGRVDHWLRQHRDVLAFCSARRQDGGAGAVYVLLRRKP